MIVSFWLCIARHVQSTEKNQFTISLEYLKENMKDEDDFLPADKCWMFLPNDTNILGVCSQACPNYLKQQVWYLPATLRKKWVTQLIFYMQISMKTCYNLTLRFFDGYDQAFPKFSK